MCLLILAWRTHPRYRLIVAANRDEFHERPAAPLARWPGPAILAGRDLLAQGTWLGVDRERRFGAVTNFREGRPPQPGAPSRGGLIPQYLGGAAGPQAFLATLCGQASAYSGFNLLLADADSLWYGSNRAEPFARALPPGVYGLSNELLDTPWPKLQRVRHGFTAWLTRAQAGPAELFELLADRIRAEETGIPHTPGLDREWERAVSAPFVRHTAYGTRCSSVVLLGTDGSLYCAERRFDPEGAPCGESLFELRPGEWP